MSKLELMEAVKSLHNNWTGRSILRQQWSAREMLETIEEYFEEYGFDKKTGNFTQDAWDKAEETDNA